MTLREGERCDHSVSESVGLRADDRSVLISERLGPREPNLRVWREAARYFVFASIFTSLSGGLHGRACTSQRYVT
jgi:hypothetical protein